MSFFGKKRFRKSEKAFIKANLDLLPQSEDKLDKTAKNRAKDNFDIATLKNLANEIFGFNGWSHSVSNQTIDYVDPYGDRFEVGVSASVTVTLKDGSFHEDIGYGTCKGLKCKGTSIAKARKIAADNALKNALSAFGKRFDSDSSRGNDIMGFLQPNQQCPVKGLSGVKRKLDLEMGGSLAQVNGSMAKQAGCLPSTMSTFSVATQREEHSPVMATSVFSQKRIVNYFSNAQDTSSCLTDDSVTYSPSQSQECNSLSSTPLSLPNGIRTSTASKRTPTTCSGGANSIDSPESKDKLRRKLKQVELELKSRESVKCELLTRLNEIEVNVAAASPNDKDNAVVVDAEDQFIDQLFHNN